jgi:hypothetical protein
MEVIQQATTAFQEFLKEEGVDATNMKDKLNEELIRKFFAKFVGTTDQGLLTKQMADAPGVIGFCVALMLALPQEGRFAAALISTEMLKAAGLPIPPAVREAALLAFEGATLASDVTDADIMRFRTRIMKDTKAALKKISGAASSAASTIATGASATLAPGGSDMPGQSRTPTPAPAAVAPPASASAAPENPFDTPLTDPHVVPVVAVSARVAAAVAKQPPALVIPARASAAGGGGASASSTSPPSGGSGGSGTGGSNGGGGGIPPAAPAQPSGPPEDPNEGRKRYLEFIQKDVLPLRQTEVITKPKGPREYTKGLEWVVVHRNDPVGSPDRILADDAFALLPVMTKEQREELDEPLKVLNRVNSESRMLRPTQVERDANASLVHDAIERGSAAWEIRVREIAQQNATWLERRWYFRWVDWADDKVNDDVRRASLTFSGAGVVAAISMVVAGIILGIRKAWIAVGGGWNLLAVAVLLTVGIPYAHAYLVTNDTLAGSLGFLIMSLITQGRDKLYAALYEVQAKEGRPARTRSTVEVAGLILKVVGLVAGVISLAVWLMPGFTPLAFALNAFLFLVWASVFLVLVDDPWTVQVKPIFVDENNKTKDISGLGESDTDHLIVERDKKGYLTVQGPSRAENLKVSMGATLVGVAVNIVCSFNGAAALGYGFFVGAWFLLLTILTVAQYFNGYIVPVFVQNFVTDLLAGSPKAIVGMFSLSFVFILTFSTAGQFKLVKNLHGYTDYLVGVPAEDDGEAKVSKEIAAKPKSDQETYASAKPVASSRTCPSREEMEKDNEGYCSRYPTFGPCVCPE